MKLEELPTDILLLIAPYLDQKAFLSFCSTSKALFTLTDDPGYWRHLVRRTFRFPDSRLLHADGARWKSLFRRLSNESHVFTWGDNNGGRAGHDVILPPMRSTPAVISWPQEVLTLSGIGPIVDLQVGGWSTSVLTSAGRLFCCGNIHDHGNNAGWKQMSFGRPELLQADCQFEATGIDHFKIDHFSSGRSHILAVSDSGCVYGWYDVGHPAVHIEIFGFPIDGDQFPGPNKAKEENVPQVEWVVAGWNCSSMYVRRVGIVLWDLDNLDGLRALRVGPTIGTVTYNHKVVRNTWYRRPGGPNARETSERAHRLGLTVGEVVKHVMLENHVVFLTDLGKLFAIRIGSEDEPVELSNFTPSPGKSRFQDISGSFRTFAVFNTDGDVLVGSTDLLDRCLTSNQSLTSVSEESTKGWPERPKALQNRGIISLAFGDWHALALTSTGRVLSLGSEPCIGGRLGLSTYNRSGGLLRSLYPRYPSTPAIHKAGQQVWFGAEQREWLRYMDLGGSSFDTFQAYRAIYANNPEFQDTVEHRELCNWLEREGSDWDIHPDLDDESSPPNERGRPTHTALKIAAGGHHSGALVLVDEPKVRKMYQLHQGFLPVPRAQTASGQRESAAANPDGSRAWAETRHVWTNSWEWRELNPFGAPRTPFEDQDGNTAHVYYHASTDQGEGQASLPRAARHECAWPMP